MIVIEGNVINNLYEASVLLRRFYEYEPLNIWYDEYDDYIGVLADGDYDDDDFYDVLFTLEEVEQFIAEH